LTGHRPYRVPTGSPLEMARAICEQEPARPSTVVTATHDEAGGAESATAAAGPEAISEVREGSPIRLRHRLEGDLDSILLKALRKEPSARYSSVEQFSEDLRRHLSGLPVMAQKDTIGYRIRKFIARNPGGVIAALLIWLSLSVALVTTIWEARIAHEQRREAEALLEEVQRQQAITEPEASAIRKERVHASSQKIASNLRIMMPELVLINYGLLLLLGIAIYFTRATMIRVAGALAGGAVFTAALVCEYRLASATGWWLSGFPQAVSPAKSVPPSILQCAAFTLVADRATRQFGWRGRALVTFIIAICGAMSNRASARLIETISVSPGITPIITSATTWAIGITLAQVAMNLIAGPARRGPMARAR
jgi:hypothetical protein